MPQVINTNVMSLNAQRNLNRTQSSMQIALGRLSSGLRINIAKDDAAGLAITTRFTAQIRGLNQAVRNANDGISMAQVGEGAMDEVTNMLQRMRELAVQAANGTYSTGDRRSIQNEVSALKLEVIRISRSVEFNGVKLLGVASAIAFHVGPNAASAENVVKASTVDLLSAGIRGTDGKYDVRQGGLQYLLGDAFSTPTGELGTRGGISVSTPGGARSALNLIDAALDRVSALRADWGTIQNRFESVVRNLQNVAENLSASRSRIQDADFAAETAEMTRTQILQQSGVAMLAQANQLPNNVLQLLG
jgi:flagellin